MPNQWDQYVEGPAPSAASKWDQYSEPIQRSVASPIPPPGMPAPPNPIQQEIQNRKSQPMAAFPGASPNVPVANDTAALAALGGIGLAGAAAGTPLIAPMVKALPYLGAGEAINYARKALPGNMGKYIPPGAEMLPALMAGGSKSKETARAAPEAEAATEAEAGTSVKVGNLPKATGDPYDMPRTPEKMELTDSTNVSKLGYHPESKTMVVEYRNGRVYEYRGVPKEMYQQSKDAESVGSFISRNVKGRYETNYRGSVLGKK